MEYLDRYLQMLLQLHGLQEMDLPTFVEVSHSSNVYYSWKESKRYISEQVKYGTNHAKLTKQNFQEKTK